MGKNLKGKECGKGICQRKAENMPHDIPLYERFGIYGHATDKSLNNAIKQFKQNIILGG